MPKAQPHIVHYNVYTRRFPSRREAMFFARSIRGGDCRVHSIRPDPAPTTYTSTTSESNCVGLIEVDRSGQGHAWRFAQNGDVPEEILETLCGEPVGTIVRSAGGIQYHVARRLRLAPAATTRPHHSITPE